MPDPSYKKYCRKEDDIFYHMVMTNTKTKTKTKTTYAIFLKSREFRYIKYDQIRPDQVRPGQTRSEKRRIQSRGPNSRTCVLVYIEPERDERCTLRGSDKHPQTRCSFKQLPNIPMDWKTWTM